MNRLKRRRIRTLGAIWVISMVVSIVGQRGRWAVADAVICLLIVLIVDLLYRKVVPLTRRWPLVIAAPLTAIIYIASVLTGLLLAIFLLVLITKGAPSRSEEHTAEL